MIAKEIIAFFIPEINTSDSRQTTNGVKFLRTIPASTAKFQADLARFIVFSEQPNQQTNARRNFCF